MKISLCGYSPRNFLMNNSCLFKISLLKVLLTLFLCKSVLMSISVVLKDLNLSIVSILKTTSVLFFPISKYSFKTPFGVLYSYKFELKK